MCIRDRGNSVVLDAEDNIVLRYVPETGEWEEVKLPEMRWQSEWWQLPAAEGVNIPFRLGVEEGTDERILPVEPFRLENFTPEMFGEWVNKPEYQQLLEELKAEGWTGEQGIADAILMGFLPLYQRTYPEMELETIDDLKQALAQNPDLAVEIVISGHHHWFSLTQGIELMLVDTPLDELPQGIELIGWWRSCIINQGTRLYYGIAIDHTRPNSPLVFLTRSSTGFFIPKILPHNSEGARRNIRATVYSTRLVTALISLALGYYDFPSYKDNVVIMGEKEWEDIFWLMEGVINPSPGPKRAYVPSIWIEKEYVNLLTPESNNQ